MKKTFFLILALMLCTIGFAQNDKSSHKEKFEQMMAEIQSRKIAFFTKHLKLTNEEAQKFWPVYYKCDEESDAARQEIRKSGKALQKAVAENTVSDEEIKSLADTYYAAIDRGHELQKLHYYEYQKVLPIKKAAMVRMVEERFMNDLLKQWKEHSSSKQKNQNPK